MRDMTWLRRRRLPLLAAACLLVAVTVALATGTDPLDGLELKQNFPNPFSDLTEIRYSLPAPGHVTLRVVNTLGLEIQSLVNETKGTGDYVARFDGTSYPSGQYTYLLEYTRTDDGAKAKIAKRMYLVR